MCSIDYTDNFLCTPILYTCASMSHCGDFVERNGAWLLTVMGCLVSCVGASFAYALKSRCTKIKCCCAYCERELMPVDSTPPAASSSNDTSIRVVQLKLVDE